MFQAQKPTATSATTSSTSAPLYKGLMYDGLYFFQIIDQAGDGNCLPLSVSHSSNCPINDADALRKGTMDAVLGWMNDGDNGDGRKEHVRKVWSAFHVSSDDDDNNRIRASVVCHRRSTVWLTSTDMCFMAMVYGFNIKALMNTTGGLQLFDTNACLIMLNLDHYCTLGAAADQSVWIYNHLHHHSQQQKKHLKNLKKSLSLKSLKQSFLCPLAWSTIQRLSSLLTPKKQRKWLRSRFFS
jgi:hypothetical protein